MTLEDDVVIREGSEEPGQHFLVLGETPSLRPEGRVLKHHVLVEEFHRGRYILPALGSSQRQRERSIAIHVILRCRARHTLPGTRLTFHVFRAPEVSSATFRYLRPFIRSLT
jgi:hypothetical protein